VSAHDDPRTAQTLRRFADVVRSAEMFARGQAFAPRPRDVIAERLRQFVAAFDREKAWPTGGEWGETNLRARALAVAELLAAQGMRARG
jgi:hypothetical protein